MFSPTGHVGLICRSFNSSHVHRRIRWSEDLLGHPGRSARRSNSHLVGRAPGIRDLRKGGYPVIGQRVPLRRDRALLANEVVGPGRHLWSPSLRSNQETVGESNTEGAGSIGAPSCAESPARALGRCGDRPTTRGAEQLYECESDALHRRIREQFVRDSEISRRTPTLAGQLRSKAPKRLPGHRRGKAAVSRCNRRS